jgi:hypothetical protein
MKKYSNPGMLVFVIACSALCSFSPKLGGDSYTIHLNNKLLVQHHVASKANTPSLSLDARSGNDKLAVYFSECGQIGRDRKLTLKDNQDKVLKEWSYANVTGEHSPMTFTTKDVTTANKNKSSVLRLYYSSREASRERLLATISFGATAASTRK